MDISINKYYTMPFVLTPVGEKAFIELNEWYNVKSALYRG
jgi:hypothetical protein